MIYTEDGKPVEDTALAETVLQEFQSELGFEKKTGTTEILNNIPKMERPIIPGTLTSMREVVLVVLIILNITLTTLILLLLGVAPNGV